MANNSGRCGVETERYLEEMNFTGFPENIGTPLENNPVIIIFDNQTTVYVSLYVNDILWKTFAPGQALVEDMRANIGMASNYTFDVGTQFSTDTAPSGTPSGAFRISVQYAR